MARKLPVEIPRNRIISFCKKNNILRLSLFGSVLRDDFSADSDVDVLVEFEPGFKIGFLKMACMEIELSEIIGHKVDLRTPAELSRYFKQEVLTDAEVQYAAQ